MKFTNKELHILLLLTSSYDIYDDLITDGDAERYLNVEKRELKENITTKLKYALLQEQDE